MAEEEEAEVNIGLLLTGFCLTEASKNLPQDCVRLAKTLQTVPRDLKLPTHPRKL